MTKIQSPKMVVIVSEDYGELGHASYFLTLCRQWDVKVVIPENRIGIADHLNPDMLFAYRTIQDCEDLIDRHEPAAVVLFSGYLVYTHEPYSFIKFSALLTRLKSKAISVFTSDPLLGIDIKLLSGNFAVNNGNDNSVTHITKRYIKSIYLAGRLQVLRRQFANDVHIYPVPIDQQIKRNKPVYYRSVSFFEDIASKPCNEKELVFVMAEIDFYRLQASRQDYLGDFLETINALAGQGYIVRVVGTPALETLLKASELHSNIQCYGTLSFSQYNEMIDRCECAFFWNYFSFSVYRRILTAKPVIFLDEGHMVSMFPELKSLGIKLLFNQQRPPIASFDSLTKPDTFRLMQEESAALCREIRRYFEDHDTNELVEALGRFK
ncbi:hypothetical protein [Alteromonas sp. I4]|uniref:hypothetical protein n=1 Tax=Marisediminitalea sp. TaxID=2662268 RepID=UPI00129F7B5A|nr:hypothetical protein AltI4_27490 [Alteromonas sp. I4]